MKFSYRLFPLIAISLVAAIVLVGCGLPKKEDAAPVGVQLFMYNWNSVAKECSQVLGPAKVDYVFISPAQEHIKGVAWWVHYQPVSYQIESRLGTRQEFANMVQTCKSSGVGVIADAVINHMSASESGTGWAGSKYTKYEYPDLYTKADFNTCGLTASKQIEDYKNLLQVQNCELLGLADLNTKSEKVQNTIANHLLDLLSLGVVGFRIDAAKHMWTDDVREIVERLPEQTLIFHEVIRGAGEPVQPEAYINSGSLWEFSYARDMRAYFVGGTITPSVNISRYQGYLPSEKALSFISNHDTERNGQSLNIALHPERFELATVMMLADPYGTPMLYSGYAFDSYDAPPPLTGAGTVKDASCDVSGTTARSDYQAGEWVCQHRWLSTIGMIAWRKQVLDQPQTDIAKAPGVVAWGRSDAGFFGVNIGKSAYQGAFTTSMKPGRYCDSVTGGSNPVQDSSCVGAEVTVSELGVINHLLEPNSAFAIHKNARLG
jgi:alpha-amylase